MKTKYVNNIGLMGRFFLKKWPDVLFIYLISKIKGAWLCDYLVEGTQQMLRNIVLITLSMAEKRL